jgi:hypothetical protein
MIGTYDSKTASSIKFGNVSTIAGGMKSTLGLDSNQISVISLISSADPVISKISSRKIFDKSILRT